MLTVKYSINATYSASVIRNDSVIEGNGLESNRTVVAKRVIRLRVGLFRAMKAGL